MAVIQWTLATIISKIRLTTGRPDASMMSDATITNYINYIYQHVLPKELKIFWGYTYYQFWCDAGIDQYVAPTGFQTLNPSVTADGFPIEWYISPDTFYQDWPDQLNKQVVATGDGTNNSFSYTIAAFPVLPRSVYVTDGTQIAQDNGVGGFIDPNTGGAVGGSINYQSAVVSTQGFTTAPAANTTITVSSETYQANRPQAILFYKTAPLPDADQTTRDDAEMFVLRPVPDQVYQIKMQGIQVPPLLVEPDDVPFRPDLGPLICYMASLEIFADFNQMDQYEQTLVQYNRYKDVSMQDTYEELIYERSIPKF